MATGRISTGARRLIDLGSYDVYRGVPALPLYPSGSPAKEPK
jgi:hypothetical protein